MSDTGKEQKSTHDGLLRIEYANNQIVVVDADGNVMSKFDGNGLLVSDSTTNRLLAGRDSAGDIKMKLSQPTFDVLTATDEQLIWSSDFDLPKISLIINTDVGTVGTGVGNVTQTYTHNLGYIPMAIGSFTYSGGITTRMLPELYFEIETAGHNYELTRCVLIKKVTSTTIDIEFQAGNIGSGGLQVFNNGTIKLLLLRETII